MAGSALRVLLVEDDPADAFLLQELVADCKAPPVELCHVETLAEALGLLRRAVTDVLLLDLSLPDAVGVETVAEVMSTAPGMAIVVLTGLDDEDTALRAMQAGAQDYLVKGKVDGALLGRALRYALERKRAEAHVRQLAFEQVARRAAEAAERRSRLIAEASRLLAEDEAALTEVARLALPLLGEGCVIDLPQPDGRVQRSIITARAQTEREWSLDAPGEDPLRRVLREGAPLLLTQVSETAREALGQPELRSLLAVPMIARGEPLGGLAFLGLGEARAYPEGDLAFARELAGRVALALDNARLHREAQLALQRKDELLSELKRSNSELEQFAYVASHDLQEPLRMVASYTQLLARRYRGRLDEDADVFIRYAVDGVTRMKRLIGDLLDYSRVGTRRRELAPTPCQDVLGRVLRGLEVAIRESQAEITCEPLPIVLGDSTQLEQLLQNLIDNALKFRGDAPPRVHLRAERQGEHYLFQVRDNGIGIAPEYFDRIFVIFQRLHGQDEYPGTGIGLATCKKIVERHGGRLWVGSTPGQGSTFLFTLPAADPLNGEYREAGEGG